jgi:hypothetical protein
MLLDIKKVVRRRSVRSIELPSRGQLLWGDAVYVRDVHKYFACSSKHVSPVELWRLSAMADLLGHSDYAFYVLDQAASRYADRLGSDHRSFQGSVDELTRFLARRSGAGAGRVTRLAQGLRTKLYRLWTNARRIRLPERECGELLDRT